MKTYVDTNLVIARQAVLDLLREPGTNGDPQVHIVTTGVTKSDAIAGLARCGLPAVRPADLRVDTRWLAVKMLDNAGLLTMGRAFAFRSVRSGDKIVELLGPGQAAVVGTFVSGPGRIGAGTVDLIPATVE